MRRLKARMHVTACDCVRGSRVAQMLLPNAARARPRFLGRERVYLIERNGSPIVEKGLGFLRYGVFG
jgi:hypothetical protein